MLRNSLTRDVRSQVRGTIWNCLALLKLMQCRLQPSLDAAGVLGLTLSPLVPSHPTTRSLVDQLSNKHFNLVRDCIVQHGEAICPGSHQGGLLIQSPVQVRTAADVYCLFEAHAPLNTH